ncbi:hypothetical protein PI124_g19628, partial [Phytophthora idaei]
MVLLNCALVGEGSVISIIIEEWKTVALLKDAIKGKNLATITCDAKDLQLFLAKTDDGAWLKSKDLLRMRKGEISNEVESRYMNEELEDPTDKICSKFPSTIPDGTIHVLVVVPKEMLVPAVATVSIKKRKLAEISDLITPSSFAKC